MSSRRTRGTIAAILISLSSIGLLPQVAHANEPAATASDTAWSVTPVLASSGVERSNFAYELEPGAHVDDAVLVRNSGVAPLTLAVSGADAFTTDAGRIDLVTETTGSADLGTWITPAAGEITIDPGQQTRVAFSVAVPADALPGDHSGALLTVLATTGDRGIAVNMRYATRVSVRVAGDLNPTLTVAKPTVAYSPSFWPWEPGTVAVGYAVSNTGNMALTARQLVRVDGPLGIGRTELVSSPDEGAAFADVREVLPGDSVAVAAAVDGVASWWPVVTVTSQVAPQAVTNGIVTNADGVPTVSTVESTAVAWGISPGLVILLTSLAVVALVVVLRIRRTFVPAVRSRGMRRRLAVARGKTGLEHGGA
ncbi:hypothetical protein GCM10022381_26750 [Leifsonia kafniensis]|uniref:DUF916 domain-containing protein n=1 Tax=Leifsonia kafniensis TaxID=475957 RepID=A0ABP7KR44_9MICO